jgi:hypothetical protein
MPLIVRGAAREIRNDHSGSDSNEIVEYCFQEVYMVLFKDI